MIMDTLTHIENYTGLGPRIARGIEAIRKMDFSVMEDGRYPIDGDDIFATLSTYTTKPASEAKPEAHRDYIDIQLIISGSEMIGTAPLGTMGEPVESLPEKDVYFYQGKTDLLRLGSDIFHMYFPQDVHAPGLAIDRPMQVRKIVMKIKVQ